MKKTLQMRRLGTSIAVPICIAIWIESTINVVEGKYFRTTYVFGTIAIAVLLFTTVMSYIKHERSWMIWVSAMQYWCWEIFDYYTRAFSGHISNELLPTLKIPSWSIQLASVMIAFLLMGTMLLFAKRIFANSKRKQHSLNQSNSKWILISGLGVSLASALRKWLWAFKNPLIDAIVHCSMLAIALFAFGIFGWFILLSNLDKCNDIKENKERIVLI